MGISCDCDCNDDYDEWYVTDNDFSRMPATSDAEHCYSCRKPLATSDVVLRILMHPVTDEEEHTYSEGVPKWLCERCGEIFMNLRATGICVPLDGNLENDLRTYWEMTGFDPNKYQERK